MSEYTPPTTYASGATGATQTTDPSSDGSSDVAASASAAKDKAVDAAQSGKQAAGEVAQTATTAAKDVAQETKSQAKQIAGKTSQQFTEQADVQKSALVDGLHSLVEQLEAMTSKAGQDDGKDGIAVEVAGKVRDAARSAADWLDGRDPSEVLDGVRAFGRERPGAYLGGSFVAGILAGRLTRGVAAGHTGNGSGPSTPDVAPSRHAEPARSTDFAEAQPSHDAGYAPQNGPGRHEEQYTDYPDTSIGSRPSPGTTPGITP